MTSGAVTGDAPVAAGTDSGVRLWNVVDTTAPAERLATLRILVGAFTVGYLLIRLPVFVQLGERDTGFDPVGVAVLLDEPAPGVAVSVLLAVTLAAGAMSTIGWRYVVTGPLFALGVLALTSYRGSWGQLLHFENPFTLHLVILAVAPAADAWSLDARRRGTPPRRRDPVAYGWPLALAGLVIVITYVIAGIAKLRYGGLDWVFGDTLRNHVAYAAARNELVGVPAAPLAEWAVGLEGVWPVVAALTVLIELGAPLALLGGRVRTAWVVLTWSMHVGILVTMRIGFPYPLFLVAFAPFFRIERLVTDGVQPVIDRFAGKTFGSRPSVATD